jgi:hypothetical protein
MAPYWWPNPAVPGGMPYIKRDGFINPEVADYPDKGKLVVNVGEYTISLAYAWYLARTSPDAFPRPADEYARRAIDQLRAWFVNRDTRMNPNMNFAQIRPGHRIDPDDGATGILDLSREIRLVEAVSLLASHPTLFDKVLAGGIRIWFAQMLNWLENSESGKRAAGSGNNLGIYYDGLVGILKLYLRRRDASAFIRRSCNNRLNVHVRPTGEMPAETARSDSMHYTFFALKGLVKLAMLSDKITKNGRYGTGVCWRHPHFKRAMAYTLPAALNEDPRLWPHRQDGSRGFRPQAGWELYYAAWLAWGNREYRFGDAQNQWARRGGVGYWGRVWLPEPSTRSRVIGRAEASAARRRLSTVISESDPVYKQRAMSSLPSGQPTGAKIGGLVADYEENTCFGIACQPFTLKDGTTIFAASIDDYGA